MRIPSLLKSNTLRSDMNWSYPGPRCLARTVLSGAECHPVLPGRKGIDEWKLEAVLRITLV